MWLPSAAAKLEWTPCGSARRSLCVLAIIPNACATARSSMVSSCWRTSRKAVSLAVATYPNSSRYPARLEAFWSSPAMLSSTSVETAELTALSGEQCSLMGCRRADSGLKGATPARRLFNTCSCCWGPSEPWKAVSHKRCRSTGLSLADPASVLPRSLRISSSPARGSHCFSGNSAGLRPKTLP